MRPNTGRGCGGVCSGLPLEAGAFASGGLPLCLLLRADRQLMDVEWCVHRSEGEDRGPLDHYIKNIALLGRTIVVDPMLRVTLGPPGEAAARGHGQRDVAKT